MFFFPLDISKVELMVFVKIVIIMWSYFKAYRMTDRENTLHEIFLETGFLCNFGALELVLEIALIDQASLNLMEILLSLPPECWY